MKLFTFFCEYKYTTSKNVKQIRAEITLDTQKINRKDTNHSQNKMDKVTEFVNVNLHSEQYS